MNERTRISIPEVLLVMVGFAGLTALYFWPMLQQPELVWSVGRDFFQNTWNLWWVQYAFDHGQPFYQTDRLFAPTGTSLAFHTISFTNSLPALVLQRGLGVGVGTAHTVLFLSAFFCSGIGGWALARYLSGAPLAAFGAGLFYAFNPYHTAMISQLNNVQFQWMPLVLLGLLWMYEQRSWSAVVLTAVALMLAAYTDWYQPLFCAMAGGTILLFRMGSDHRWGDRKFWLQLGVMAALAVLGMLPGALPLMQQMGAAGSGELQDPIRYVGEMQLTGMSPNGYQAHLMWPVLLGWSSMLLLLFTAWRVRERGIGSFWCLLAVGFILLQGPYLVVLNHHFPQIPMPMALFPHLPVLNMIRVPHRFLILLILGITGLLAYGLREFQIQRGAVATFLVLPLMALELQLAKPHPVSLQPAPVYAQLAADPEDYAVLEMPIDYRDGYTMWLQTKHQKKLLAGYTSHILPAALPGLKTDLMRALHPDEVDTDILGLPEFLPVEVDSLSDAQLEAWRRELLVDKGVRFVVFHKDADFAALSSRFQTPDSALEKIKVALMPYRWNPAQKQAARARKTAVKNFMTGLAEHSQQGRALIEKLFGPPNPDLGNRSTEVWDLRPWAKDYLELNAAPEEVAK